MRGRSKRLKQAQENAALLTTFNEVDMTNIMEMRKENQQDFQTRYGIKLGFMSFFVKACVVALKNFPAVNAEIDGDEIIYKNYYNLSFAVGTEKGLVGRSWWVCVCVCVCVSGQRDRAGRNPVEAGGPPVTLHIRRVV